MPDNQKNCSREVPYEGLCVLKPAYLAAIAEFDRLWGASSGTLKKERMEELISIIETFEKCPPPTISNCMRKGEC